MNFLKWIAFASSLFQPFGSVPVTYDYEQRLEVQVDDCQSRFSIPPCDGSVGRCTVNKDGTLGGFVADTANVETFWQAGSMSSGGELRNRPYIGTLVQVCDRARITEDAKISGEVVVTDRAHVHGNARIFYKARVYGNSEIFEEAQVGGGAHVFGNAKISGRARVISGPSPDPETGAYTQVFGHALVSGVASIEGNARIFGNAVVTTGTYYTGLSLQFPENDRGSEWSESSRVVYDRTLLEDQNLTVRAQKNPSPSEKAERVFTEQLSECVEKMDQIRTEDPERICSVCLDPLLSKERLIFPKCAHFLCKSCFDRLGEKICPSCREKIGEFNLEVQKNDGS